MPSLAGNAPDAPADPANVKDPGVDFPAVDGVRSTMATNQAIFVDAARAVDDVLAAELAAEDDWRANYPVHLRRLLEAGVRSPAATLAISTAGLESAHRQLVMDRGGERKSLAEAVTAPPAGAPAFATVEVEGEGLRPPSLSIPYGGSVLAGTRLQRQLLAWVKAGVCEPSVVTSLEDLADHPQWLDLRDLTVVLLGAGSEMGPLRQLSTWGATVVAVDLPRPDAWRRIIRTVRKGSGRALLPLRSPLPPGAERSDGEIADRVGADLLTEWDAIADWLAELPGPMTLGDYVYADGATHVRTTMAADALTLRLASRRKDLSLAFLATPTDVFAVPPEALAEARRRYEALGWRRQATWPARIASNGQLFEPSYMDTARTDDGTDVGIADSLIPQQGPNYALAKRLQRWRASVAREQGMRVSSNIAPPTRTRSVVKNRMFAASYAGSRWFGMHVFEPQTSNALMAALLVYDLRSADSAGNPHVRLGSPLELFMQNAVHGGMWRTPYVPRSVLGVAAVLGAVELAK